MPEPVASVRTSWRTDPFSRGSCSFLAVRLLPRPAGCVTSTVRGAQESGSRYAERVDAVADRGERMILVRAGSAGATAARLLAHAGNQAQVIEARIRTGGRIRTAQPEDWQGPLQLRAAWLRDSDDDPILERLILQGIRTASVSAPPQGLTSDGELVHLAVARAGAGCRCSRR